MTFGSRHKSEVGAWPSAGAAARGQLLRACPVHRTGAPHFAEKKLHYETYHFGVKEVGSEGDQEFTLF